MPSTDIGSQDRASSQYPDAPYVSVVVTARNDDHGGNLLGRMQIFVTAWINQAQRHHLDSELIIVEWNPPAGRDRLATALHWPVDTSPCHVRIIEVPPEMHARYQHAAALPLYQMMAKNVGIRRARGEFILATNIDIVFSDELMQFLAARRLEQGRMYRIDRHDVMSDVPLDGSLDEQLNYCASHLIRLCSREGTFALNPDGTRKAAHNDIASVHSGLSFGGGWYPIENYPSCETFRWIYDNAEIIAKVPECGAILILETEPGPGLSPTPQPLQIIDEKDSKVAELTIAGRTTVAFAIPTNPGPGLRTLRLRVPGGGAPIWHEQRILNLAVFRCDWAVPNPAKHNRPSLVSVIRQNRPTLQRLLGAYRKYHGVGALLSSGPRILWRSAQLLRRRGDDIFEAGMDFQVGAGWSYLEEAGGEKFRWVSKDAQFVIRMPQATSKLALLLEPGPGLGYLPFVLVVRDSHHKEIARAHVQGLTYLEFDVPPTPGEITTLVFTPEGQGSPTGSDPRLLNFRVLACGAGSARDSAPRTKVDVPSNWPTLTIDTRPATRDWSLEQEPWRRQLQAMGKPPFLHTNACGDFTLMAREHWFDVRGYGELDLFSIHLDSMLCYAAHHAGASEEVLREPMRIFHIEHGIGTGWTPEGQAQLEARIARRGIQSVSHDDLVWLISEMRSLHTPLIFNLDDWGLAEYDLAENSPTRTMSAHVSDAAAEASNASR